MLANCASAACRFSVLSRASVSGLPVGVKCWFGQARQGVHVAILQELAADGFAGLQNRVAVLHEVELLVAGGGHKVGALVAEHVFAGLALLAHHREAAFLAKGRVGQEDTQPCGNSCSSFVRFFWPACL